MALGTRNRTSLHDQRYMRRPLMSFPLFVERPASVLEILPTQGDVIVQHNQADIHRREYAAGIRQYRQLRDDAIRLLEHGV